MSSCRLLCLLLLPFLAVHASDDIEDEYGTQTKPDTKFAGESLAPLSDGRSFENNLQLPGSWLALLERQSGPVSQEWTETEKALPLSPTKRVFCNGFTGCGGRFRGRRRQRTQVLLKRPFCNSGGCAWRGRRSGGPSREMARKVMQLPPEIRKRLFCNTFDGCRGLKRALYSNWLSKLQGIADDL